MEKEIKLTEDQYSYVRENVELLDSDMTKFLNRAPDGIPNLINWLLYAGIEPTAGITDYSDISFASSNIDKININPAVTAIPQGTFRNVKITEVIIPANVKTIGSNAFNGCKKLKKVVMTNNVDTVGTGAFANCTNLVDCYFTNAWTRTQSALGVFAGDDKAQIKIVEPKVVTITYTDAEGKNQVEKIKNDYDKALSRCKELREKDIEYTADTWHCNPNDVEYYKNHRVWITQADMDKAIADSTKTEALDNTLCEFVSSQDNISDYVTRFVDKYYDELDAYEADFGTEATFELDGVHYSLIFSESHAEPDALEVSLINNDTEEELDFTTIYRVENVDDLLYDFGLLKKDSNDIELESKEPQLTEKASTKAKDVLAGNFMDKINAEIVEDESFYESILDNKDPFDILNNFNVD